MNHEYIVNGSVARDKIAMDIKYRKLKRASLEQLLNDPNIKDAFFGISYSDKKPSSDWNQQYLDLLSYAVVGESFNRDYLLYLDTVAEHVASRKKQKKILTTLAIIIVVSGISYLLLSKI